MLPGSKIIWDIHYHAVGEEITDSVGTGVYFYPKGQEPKYRTVLGSFDAIAGGRAEPRHRAELDQRAPGVRT